MANAVERNAAQYIFICGGGHSGTTLMLALLDSHKDIAAIPRETGIFHRIQDDGELRARVAEWPAKYQLPANVRYIAEKTPIHAIYMARVFHLFPEAKVVFMLRDGRDATLSGEKRLGDYLASVKEWRKINRLAQPFLTDPRVHVVRHEALVSATEDVLRKVCDFLGLDFDPAMLAHHETPRRWWDNEIRPADASAPLVGRNHTTNRNWQINQPIFDATGQWRTMPDAKKAVFKSVAGQMLIDFGYAEDSNW